MNFSRIFQEILEAPPVYSLACSYSRFSKILLNLRFWCLAEESIWTKLIIKSPPPQLSIYPSNYLLPLLQIKIKAMYLIVPVFVFYAMQTSASSSLVIFIKLYNYTCNKTIQYGSLQDQCRNPKWTLVYFLWSIKTRFITV